MHAVSGSHMQLHILVHPSGLAGFALDQTTSALFISVGIPHALETDPIGATTYVLS